MEVFVLRNHSVKLELGEVSWLNSLALVSRLESRILIQAPSLTCHEGESSIFSSAKMERKTVSTFLTGMLNKERK